jgi:hypothetical protein
VGVIEEARFLTLSCISHFLQFIYFLFMKKYTMSWNTLQIQGRGLSLNATFSVICHQVVQEALGNSINIQFLLRWMMAFEMTMCDCKAGNLQSYSQNLHLTFIHFWFQWQKHKSCNSSRSSFKSTGWSLRLRLSAQLLLSVRLLDACR